MINTISNKNYNDLGMTLFIGELATISKQTTISSKLLGKLLDTIENSEVITKTVVENIKKQTEEQERQKKQEQDEDERLEKDREKKSNKSQSKFIKIIKASFGEVFKSTFKTAFDVPFSKFGDFTDEAKNLIEESTGNSFIIRKLTDSIYEFKDFMKGSIVNWTRKLFKRKDEDEDSTKDEQTKILKEQSESNKQRNGILSKISDKLSSLYKKDNTAVVDKVEKTNIKTPKVSKINKKIKSRHIGYKEDETKAESKTKSLLGSKNILGKVSEPLKRAGIGFGSILKKTGSGLLSIGKTLFTGVSSFVASLGTVSVPILAIAVGLTVLGFVIYKFRDEITNTVIPIFASISDAWEQTKNQFKAVGDVIMSFVDKIKNVIETIKNFSPTNMAKNVKEKVMKSDTVQKVSKTYSKVKNFFTGESDEKEDVNKNKIQDLGIYKKETIPNMVLGRTPPKRQYDNKRLREAINNTKNTQEQTQNIAHSNINNINNSSTTNANLFKDGTRNNNNSLNRFLDAINIF